MSPSIAQPLSSVNGRKNGRIVANTGKYGSFQLFQQPESRVTEKVPADAVKGADLSQNVSGHPAVIPDGKPQKAVEKKPRTAFGEGNQKRAFDAAEAERFWTAAELVQPEKAKPAQNRHRGVGIAPPEDLDQAVEGSADEKEKKKALDFRGEDRIHDASFQKFV